MTISYMPVQAKRVCGVVSEAMTYLLAISARIVSTTELATVTTLSKNVSDGDNVILLDISLDQIIDANITADAVTIKPRLAVLPESNTHPKARASPARRPKCFRGRKRRQLLCRWHGELCASLPAWLVRRRGRQALTADILRERQEFFEHFARLRRVDCRSVMATENYCTRRLLSNGNRFSIGRQPFASMPYELNLSARRNDTASRRESNLLDYYKSF